MWLWNPHFCVFNETIIQKSPLYLVLKKTIAWISTVNGCHFGKQRTLRFTWTEHQKSLILLWGLNISPVTHHWVILMYSVVNKVNIFHTIFTVLDRESCSIHMNMHTSKRQEILTATFVLWFFHICELISQWRNHNWYLIGWLLTMYY